MDRRNFLKDSTILAASLGVIPSFSTKAQQVKVGQEPHRHIKIGVIGCGMGIGDLHGVLQNSWAECTGVCDVDQQRLNTSVDNLKKNFPKQTQSVKSYTDFREMLKDKSMDGVIIATPDHWHTYIFAEAIKSGKNIYVEKPVANSIAECNLLMDLQRKYKKSVNCGLWQTSIRYFQAANEILKTGVLGNVYKIKIWMSRSTDPIPFVADSEVPQGLDYEMWLGPSPKRPFNLCHKQSWRNYWSWGGGQQTDWGVHWIDSALEGAKSLEIWNGKDYPESVFSAAYKDPATFYETPSCQTSIIQFKDFHIEWSQQSLMQYGRMYGVAWIGNKATLVCNREGYELIPEKDSKGNLRSEKAQLVGPEGANGIAEHTKKWCNCIVNNSVDTPCPIERGAFSTIIAHMANISFRTNSQVIYDPISRRFVNNEKANALLKPTYRSPWKFPEV